MNRAEKEKVITVKIDMDKDVLVNYLNFHMIKDENSPATPYIKDAIDDALKRSIYPSIEREVRSELNDMAEEQAIEVFGG